MSLVPDDIGYVFKIRKKAIPMELSTDIHFKGPIICVQFPLIPSNFVLRFMNFDWTWTPLVRRAIWPHNFHYPLGTVGYRKANIQYRETIRKTMLRAGYFNAKVRVHFKHEKNTNENFNFHYFFGFPIVNVCDTM